MKFYNKKFNNNNNENRLITHNQLVKIMSYKNILKTNALEVGDKKIELNVDSVIMLSFNDASEIITCVEKYIEKNIQQNTTEKTLKF